MEPGEKFSGKTLDDHSNNNFNSDSQQSNPISGIKCIKMKPPCKKKYQEVLDDIWSKIKSLEKDYKSLQLSNCIEKDDQMKSLKQQRSAISARRKEICDELESIAKHTCTKKGNLMKFQHNFQYKCEAHINNAISKLEYQLKANNFRASEERKIVQEIDCLNRSKKSLAEYNALKDELNEFRQRQANLRKEKDAIFSKLQSIKTQEDALKTQEFVKQEKMAKIKKSLDEFYDQKRELVLKHKKEICDFELMKDQRSKELLKKREEEQKAAQSAKIKEMKEEKLQIKPFQEEKLLCETLLSYLQRYEYTPSSTPSSDSVCFLTSPCCTPETSISKELDNGETVYVLKKKEVEDFPCHSSRKIKKGRTRDKKRASQNKVLHHTPQVFEQFLRLKLQAPSTVKEIPTALEQLKAKKKYYSHMVDNSQAATDCEHIVCTLTSSNDQTQAPSTAFPDYPQVTSNSSDSPPNDTTLHEDYVSSQGSCSDSDVITSLNAPEITKNINKEENMGFMEDIHSLTEDLFISNMVDDGYSEVPVNETSEECDEDLTDVDKPRIGPRLAMTAPSDTCCSNSSDADSALAEEIKSLESPEIVYTENKFLNWQNV